MFRHMCQEPITTVKRGNFPSTANLPGCLSASHPSPHPCPQATPDLLATIIDQLALPEVLYKRDRKVYILSLFFFFFGWGISGFLSIMILRCPHAFGYINSSLLFMVNHIPLYEYAIICLSISLLMDIFFPHVLGYDKQSCYEHLCPSLCVDILL